MKLIYTQQSYKSLEESIQFLLKVQKIPLEKVQEIKSKLLNKADSLEFNPQKGQIEEYLMHLNKGHRRLIEGTLKLFTELEVKIFTLPTFSILGSILI